jgi:hypothetical protein
VYRGAPVLLTKMRRDAHMTNSCDKHRATRSAADCGASVALRHAVVSCGSSGSRRRPYTFVVVSVLNALPALLSVVSVPTDIFPSIDIPVVSVMWSYGRLSATEMENTSPNAPHRGAAGFID